MTKPTPVTPIEASGNPVADRLGARVVEVPPALLDRLTGTGAEILLDDHSRAEAGRDWWPIAIGWATEGGWGYGDGPKSLEEFYTRYGGLTAALLDNPNLFGFCYTQLTDVEQEHNGLYFYDRRPKFDLQRLHDLTSRPAYETTGPTAAPPPLRAEGP